MILENIDLHDKYQFEMKLGYRVLDEGKITPYRIEMYFFIPNSLDVNKHNYSKKDFFSDLQTYIRFKSPVVLLRNIAGDDENAPIVKLKNSFSKLVHHPDDESVSNYTRQIKMFSCVVKSALRDHVHFIEKQKTQDNLDSLVKEYLRLVPEITAAYRHLRLIINAPNITSKIYAIYQFGDEYLSFMIEESAYGILNYLNRHHKNRLQLYSDALYNLIRIEIEHRSNDHYPSIPRENDDNEELIFRKSVLKKFMSSVLHLETTTEKEGLFLEQVLFGIAAGLSMIFATGVAFYSQYRYGTISTTVFVILIISYMFKDRIKEILRMYFSKRIKKSLFDHKITFFTAEKEKIGEIKEVFYFTKEDNVPEEIIKIRNKDHITEIENSWMGEKIAVYAGNVSLLSEELLDLYHDYIMEGINHIMRYDISRYLHKMDNPKKPLFVLNDQGHKEISGKRVYHLNTIIKFTSTQGTSYRRYRIVMNRDGIRRIEEVLSK
jgi:hypothetical protein